MECIVRDDASDASIDASIDTVNALQNKADASIDTVNALQNKADASIDTVNALHNPDNLRQSASY